MKILFVCTGNICRSPTADGIARARVAAQQLDWQIDSAGTHAYHIGEPPDSRTIHVANRFGIDLRNLRARQIQHEDFQTFDWILAMDRGHLQRIERMKPRDARAQTALFLKWHPDHPDQDVPDPYYDDLNAFIHVFQLVEQGVDAFLEHLQKR
ncbi:MAG: low molecular weight phosphotyrosine protein phosphatase [Acidobacteria bacterium]|nr:low molecular weight phosphotyrosine protein phosphatase [Acidobacteriota bacterium]MCB9397305.1 low molecular weight phosphotyrosine protein phosphatase [Acidobacteriota bacterium]